MNLGSLENFFVTYLKENKIDYNLANKIYTIKFKKEHAQIYGKELKATFDKKVAEKNNIHLIENGSFLLDNIIAEYTGNLVYSNLKLEKKESDWTLLEEKRDELNKSGQEFETIEKDSNGFYFLLELVFTSSKEKRKILVPVIWTKDFTCTAYEFENNSFKALKKKYDFEEELEMVCSKLEELIPDKIERFEKAHYQNLTELSNIVTKHSEQKYKELQAKEDKLRAQLAKLRKDIIGATTFKKKQDLTDKQKQIQKKLNNMVEKNQKVREELKKEHDFEVEAVKKREYSIQAKAVAVAKVDFPTYSIKYKDAEFIFIPALKKIINSDGTDAIKKIEEAEDSNDKSLIIERSAGSSIEKKKESVAPKATSFLDKALNRKAAPKKEVKKEKPKLSSFL